MEQAYVLRLYDTDLLSFSLSEKIGHWSPWTWS